MIFRKLNALFILSFIFLLQSCNVIKLALLYTSENHRKPKQELIPVGNDPKYIFEFDVDDRGYQEFISQIKYSPYTRNKKGVSYTLKSYLDNETSTTAFLVVRNDTILYEDYFEGYDENSLLPSWSIAKSFTSSLVGIAVQEGKLNVFDHVIEYLPHLKEYNPTWKELTIEHLLNMRSGIDFNEENYINPFSSISKLYTSKDFMKFLKKVKFKYAPGDRHYYSSLDTEILSLVLEKALNIPLAQYLQEKIWKPLGMESSATWTLDSKKKKNSKSFCCLNVTLKDYAKFAKLYLDKGNWDGRQIIDAAWVNHSTQADFTNNCYQYQWYSKRNSFVHHKDSSGKNQITTFPDSLSAQREVENSMIQNPMRLRGSQEKWAIKQCGPEFYALGVFGQEIFVDPKTNMIFIRLGKKWDLSSINVFYLIRREIEKFES